MPAFILGDTPYIYPSYAGWPDVKPIDYRIIFALGNDTINEVLSLLNRDLEENDFTLQSLYIKNRHPLRVPILLYILSSYYQETTQVIDTGQHQIYGKYTC